MVGIESDYNAQDIRLQLAINSASRTVENIVGRALSRRTHEEYLSTKRNSLHGYDVYGVGNSGRISVYKQVPLYLKHYPIDLTAAFEVYYDPSQTFSEATKLDPSEYIVDEVLGTLILKKPVNDYKRSLKVVYTAGFKDSVDLEGGIVEDITATPPQERALAPNLPADLMQAALWQAQLVYEKQYANNINVRESRGEGSTNTTRYVNIHAVAPETMAILVQNRRMKISVI